VASRNIDGAHYFKAYGDPDAVQPIKHRKTHTHGLKVYPLQLHRLISDEADWREITPPKGWPANELWPPSAPHRDLFRAPSDKKRNATCFTCDEHACSCSIDDFRSSRANWAFNLDLRSLSTDGEGCGLFAHRAFRSGTVVGELTGIIRPHNNSMPAHKAQFALRLELINSTAGILLPAPVPVCLDMSEQCGPLTFANHSCKPNLAYLVGRVGESLCFMLATTRLVKAHEELTIDWQSRRYGRECRSNPDECTCNAEE
jgi:hypothetical protein